MEKNRAWQQRGRTQLQREHLPAKADKEKIHNLTSLRNGGQEGARMNSLETWKSKPAKTCPTQKQQRALLLFIAISKDVH